MHVKTVIEEDYTNYKLPCMTIGTCYCDWKCCKESNIPITVCHNNPLFSTKTIDIPTEEILGRYIDNPITKAICFGGLEPMLQFEEVYDFIFTLRNKYDRSDPIIIYTGYYPEEIPDKINKLKPLKNIIIKFGRYIPNQKPHYDEVLGVELASDNQKGIQIC